MKGEKGGSACAGWQAGECGCGAEEDSEPEEVSEEEAGGRSTDFCGRGGRRRGWGGKQREVGGVRGGRVVWGAWVWGG